MTTEDFKNTLNKELKTDGFSVKIDFISEIGATTVIRFKEPITGNEKLMKWLNSRFPEMSTTEKIDANLAIIKTPEQKNNRHVVKFLDYEIVNSGNSDDWVISKKCGLYESHLGNYSSVLQAKRYCVIYFMIARPHVFACNIANRVLGIDGTYHDWFLLKNTLKKENIEMPTELTASQDGNCGIRFLGERLNI